jgi:hypothetical protein
LAAGFFLAGDFFATGFFAAGFLATVFFGAAFLAVFFAGLVAMVFSSGIGLHPGWLRIQTGCGFRQLIYMPTPKTNHGGAPGAD